MSQSKNTRSKRKLLPTEFTVSLKTPKSRQYLFSDGSVSNTPKECADGTEDLKRSKRKKLRKTQNFPFADETKRDSSDVSSASNKRKKTSSKSSVSSAVDGDVSSDVFHELEEKPKTKKSKRKKIKLPDVCLDDFESLDNTLKCSEKTISHKNKNSSMDSISSSTSDVINVNTSEKKIKKKKGSKKSKQDDENNTIPKTRSSRKTKNHGNVENVEMNSENKENIITDIDSNSSTSRKHKSRRNKSKSSDKINKSDENIEKTSVESSRASRKRRHPEPTDETEESEKNIEKPSSGSSKKSRKKRRLRKTESNEKLDEIELNIEKTGAEDTRPRKRNKRTANPESTDETEELEKPVEKSRSSKKSRLILNAEIIIQTEETEENINKSNNKLTRIFRKSMEILNSESTDESDKVAGSIKKSNSRTSRTSLQTLNKSGESEGSNNTRTSKPLWQSLNGEITSEIGNGDFESSSRSSRRTWNIASNEISVNNEELETNDSKLNVKNSNGNLRSSRKIWDIASDEISLNNEEEEKTDAKLNVGNVRTSSNRFQCPNLDISDKNETVHKSIDMSRSRNSTSYRKSIKTEELETMDASTELQIDDSMPIPSTEIPTVSEALELNEEEYDIGKPGTSRKSFQCLTSEVSGTNKTFDKSTGRLSGRNSRSSRGRKTIEPETLNKTSGLQKNDSIIPSNEITAISEDIEANEEKLDVVNPRTSKVNENLGEDIGLSSSRNLRRSRRSDKTLESITLDKSSDIQRNHSRKSWQINPDNGELAENIGDNEINKDIASFHKPSDSVLQSSKGSETNGIEKPNVSFNNTLKSPFKSRKSVANQKSRKRWTIINDNEVRSSISKQNSDHLVERPENQTLSEIMDNSNVRRSVRKRWSTEMKKKSFNPNELKIKEINDSLHNSKEESLKIELENSPAKIKSSPNTSRNSIKKENSTILDSTFVQNTSTETIPAFYYSEPEIHNSFIADNSPRRSKRISKSLDSLEGIEPLDNTMTEENAEIPFSEKSLRNSCNRYSQSAGPILKRRGTYDLEVGVTEVSILKSLSESNISNSESPIEDNTQNVRKSVRFQHVTRRKPISRRIDPMDSPENKPQASIMKKTPKLANKSVSFDHTIFSACTSSTPLHSLRKNALLKQTLTKNDVSGVSSKRRSRSLDEKRDKSSNRIRMPNFAKIHQRLNDRMEDIAQMAARKAERARLLLSGQKPNANSTCIHNDSQKKTDDKVKHPKQLKFNDVKQEASSTNKSASTSVRNKKEDTPKKLKIEDKIKRIPVVCNKNTIGKLVAGSSRNFLAKPAVDQKIVIPAKLDTAKSTNLLAKSGIPKRLQNIKGLPNAMKRVEEIKSIATKSKPQHDTKEEKRTILKGVRGNRRFELLMKMRNK